MQAIRFMGCALLVAGFLSGCGGNEADATIPPEEMREQGQRAAQCAPGYTGYYEMVCTYAPRFTPPCYNHFNGSDFIEHLYCRSDTNPADVYDAGETSYRFCGECF
ncbi:MULTISPECIES: hypothetical protein [Corallococcus]|uniref:hypothetical protein n=1 Tax=Corallococcus TaxID=83461 RepID=UPI00117C4F32|nr:MULTISPECIES: hypothetical protein [Corallococcus]NBD09944.1 hypothetical protein [Corallococcus silvisoli]TSC20968.1 hypothetical protein FOF48_35055 [Corallococcus sp. Z5C101001]